jgi:hypothetical protein
MIENIKIIRPEIYKDDEMNDYIIESNILRMFYIEFLAGLIMLAYSLILAGYLPF